MDSEQQIAPSRLRVLADKMQDKRYRDAYVASHTRQVLADQMRNFRGDLSQGDFGAEIDKRQTVVSRLENPAYTGWSLRTMLEIARKRDVAVFCRFVDLPTFLKLTDDFSDEAMCPASYDQSAMEKLAEAAEFRSDEQALKALFSPSTNDSARASTALGDLGLNSTVRMPAAANDDSQEIKNSALSAS